VAHDERRFRVHHFRDPSLDTHHAPMRMRLSDSAQALLPGHRHRMRHFAHFEDRLNHDADSDG
jgi:hypothetical protein